MKKTKQRILAYLLIIVMCIGLLQTSAIPAKAEEPEELISIDDFTDLAWDLVSKGRTPDEALETLTQEAFRLGTNSGIPVDSGLLRRAAESDKQNSTRITEILGYINIGDMKYVNLGITVVESLSALPGLYAAFQNASSPSEIAYSQLESLHISFNLLSRSLKAFIPGIGHLVAIPIQLGNNAAGLAQNLVEDVRNSHIQDIINLINAGVPDGDVRLYAESRRLLNVFSDLITVRNAADELTVLLNDHFMLHNSIGGEDYRSEIIGTLTSVNAQIREIEGPIEQLVNALENATGQSGNGNASLMERILEILTVLNTSYLETGKYEPRHEDPLVLDLTGDGLETVCLDAGVYFDMNGDGFATLTGWITPNNGFLVLDWNQNGIIDSGRELFGNQTLLADGETLASNGFEALAIFDENKDWMIDGNDPVYDYLQVWVDKNMDGITDPGELYTLPELGIESISLSFIVPFSGNILIHTSYYTTFSGECREIGEYWFISDPFQSREREHTPRTAEILALPDVPVSGRLVSLHTAMVNDAVLQGMVEDYVSEPSHDVRRSLVRPIIFRWAEVEDVAINSRGSFVNGRELAVLEKVFAQEYIDAWGSTNPNNVAGHAQTGIFAEYANCVFLMLEIQSRLSGVVSEPLDIEDVIYKTEQVLLDDEDTGLNLLRSINSYLGAVDKLNQTRIRLYFQHRFPLVYFSNNITGTLGNDVINVPNNRGYFVYGQGGNDVIHAKQGNNTIDPGAGNNQILGGSDRDTYVIGRGYGVNTITAGLAVASNVTNDRLVHKDGITRSDVEFTRVGNHLVIVIAEDDLSADNRIVFLDFYPSHWRRIAELEFSDGEKMTTAQILNSSAAIYGTDGNDTITVGSSAGHIIYGLGGDDVIRPNAGNNTIDPGTGNNQIFGGSGRDTYVIGRGYSVNTITAGLAVAGNVTNDRLVLKDGITRNDVEFTRVGNHLVIVIAEDDLSADNRIVFLDFYPSHWRRIAELEFSDGEKMTTAQILSLTA